MWSRQFHKNFSQFSILTAFLLFDLLFIAALQKKILTPAARQPSPKRAYEPVAKRSCRIVFRDGLLDESRRH